MSIVRLSEFITEEENISSYLMRVKHMFKVNNIKDEKQVAVLITVIRSKILVILSNVVSPAETTDKTYFQLEEILRNHFIPEISVVAVRYNFYNRNQTNP